MNNYNSDKEKNSIDSISNKLIIIGFIGIGSLAVGVAVFFLHLVVNENFTEGQQNIWVAFGEYFGGSLSPILAFLALIALLFSIHYQVTEFQKSTAQLKESSIALINQNTLIQKQISEAKDFRVKEAEIKKIDATNKLIIEMIRCLKNLVEIKKSYFYELQTHPIQRFFKTKEILIYAQPSNVDFSELHYLTKIRLNKTQIVSKATNLIFFIDLFLAYNSLLELWQTRNEFKDLILIKIISENLFTESLNSPEEFQEFSKILKDKIGIAEMSRTISLTENALVITDEILEGLMKGLSDLPTAAESFISADVLNEYTPIIKYITNEKDEIIIRQKVPSVNETLYEEIVGKKPPT